MEKRLSGNRKGVKNFFASVLFCVTFFCIPQNIFADTNYVEKAEFAAPLADYTGNTVNDDMFGETLFNFYPDNYVEAQPPLLNPAGQIKPDVPLMLPDNDYWDEIDNPPMPKASDTDAVEMPPLPPGLEANVDSNSEAKRLEIIAERMPEIRSDAAIISRLPIPGMGIVRSVIKTVDTADTVLTMVMQNRYEQLNKLPSEPKVAESAATNAAPPQARQENAIDNIVAQQKSTEAAAVAEMLQALDDMTPIAKGKPFESEFTNFVSQIKANPYSFTNVEMQVKLDNLIAKCSEHEKTLLAANNNPSQPFTAVKEVARINPDLATNTLASTNLMTTNSASVSTNAAPPAVTETVSADAARRLAIIAGTNSPTQRETSVEPADLPSQDLSQDAVSAKIAQIHQISNEIQQGKHYDETMIEKALADASPAQNEQSISVSLPDIKDILKTLPPEPKRELPFPVKIGMAIQDTFTLVSNYMPWHRSVPHKEYQTPSLGLSQIRVIMPEVTNAPDQFAGAPTTVIIPPVVNPIGPSMPPLVIEIPAKETQQPVKEIIPEAIPLPTVSTNAGAIAPPNPPLVIRIPAPEMPEFMPTLTSDAAENTAGVSVLPGGSPFLSDPPPLTQQPAQAISADAQKTPTNMIPVPPPANKEAESTAIMASAPDSAVTGETLYYALPDSKTPAVQAPQRELSKTSIKVRIDPSEHGATRLVNFGNERFLR